MAKTKEKELKTFIEELVCETCDAVMISDGAVIMPDTDKLKNAYRCEACDTIVYLSEIYPRVTYKDK